MARTEARQTFRQTFTGRVVRVVETRRLDPADRAHFKAEVTLSDGTALARLLTRTETTVPALGATVQVSGGVRRAVKTKLPDFDGRDLTIFDGRATWEVL